MKDQLEIITWDDFEDNIVALGKHLGLEPEQAQEIEDNGHNSYTYGKCSYYVGTEEDMEEKCRDYLDEDYMWKDAVANDHTTSGKEEWIDEVIKMDSYGSILGSYDGSEDTEKVNDIDRYIIRMD